MAQKPGTGTLNGGAGGDGGGGESGGLTDAQKEEVSELVNGAVNGAITNQLARFKKTFTEEIGKTLGETLSPFSAQLTEVLAKVGQAPQGGAAGGDKKKGEMSPEFQEALNKAQGQVAELTAQVAKERAAREEERAQAEKTREEGKRREERDQLGQILRARGVPETQARAAVAMWAEEGRIGRQEDGTIIVKIKKGTGQAAYVDEIPLDKGVDEWLKTDDGKSFLPARQTGGAGGLGARPANTGDAKKDSKAQAAHDLAKSLLGA